MRRRTQGPPAPQSLEPAPQHRHRQVLRWQVLRQWLCVRDRPRVPLRCYRDGQNRYIQKYKNGGFAVERAGVT